MKKKYNNTKKILFTPSRGIGDLIHSLPLIHSLKNYFPNSSVEIPVVDERQKGFSLELEKMFKGLIDFSYNKINVAFENERKELYRSEDYPNRFLEDLDKRKIFEKRLYEYYLKGKEYSLAILPKMYTLEGIVCDNQICFNHLSKKRSQHVVDRNLMFADYLEIPKLKKFDLNISNSLVKDLSGKTIKLPNKYLVILLSSGRPIKKWNIENYKKVINFCLSKNYAPVLIGSQEEKSDAKKLERKGVTNLVSKGVNLENVAKITSRSSLVLGADTGLIHLADAVGAKTIGLYGQTRPEKFAPYNNKDLVISTSDTTKKVNDIKPYQVIKRIKDVFK